MKLTWKKKIRHQPYIIIEGSGWSWCQGGFYQCGKMVDKSVGTSLSCKLKMVLKIELSVFDDMFLIIF